MDKNLLLFYLVGIFTVVFFGIGVFYFTYKRRVELSRLVLIAFIIFSFYLPIAQLLKYYSLHFYIDFAAWGELLNNIIKTGVPTSSIQGFFSGQGPEYHWFSAHFTPFIYLFAAPFKFLPYSETIIVLNGLLMLSSAIPLYKLAVHLGGNKKLGLFIATLFLWYPTFQYITLYEFEMLRFSIPVLLWMLYFWEVRKITLFFLLAFTAVLVREEVGLTVATFGLYVLLVERKRIKGIAATILGLGGFFIITQMVMPFFSTAEDFKHVAVGSFSKFGGTPIEMIKEIVTNPKLLLATIMHPVKFANIGMLFLPLLFIPLLAPSALIGLLANIGVGFVSDSLVHTSYMLYYVAPSAPFIFYAFIKAWPKLMNVIAGSKAATISDGSTSLTAGIASSAPRNDRIEQSAMFAVLAGMLAANIFFGPSPISLQFWFKNIRPAPFRTQDFHYSVYHVTAHQRKVEQFVSMIPNDAVVSAQQFLRPRLFTKRGAMIFPQLTSNDGSITAAYVFLDTTNNSLSSQSPAFVTPEEMDFVFRDNAQWEHVASDDGYVLYKRKI